MRSTHAYILFQKVINNHFLVIVSREYVYKVCQNLYIKSINLIQKYPHFIGSLASSAPSSVNPFPDNKLPSRLVPRLPNSRLRKPSFCFLVSFSIVSVASIFSTQKSSRHLIIFIVSCISSFDIISFVVSGPKIFYEFLHLILRLPLVI